jgi:RimJ/RimL family protein N-acetyltransferase
MELRLLEENEDKLDDLFASAEAQQLLEIYDEYYPRMGFDPPWVAYLVIMDGEVVGTGSFTAAPEDGVVEIAFWTFADFEGQGVASFVCAHLVDIALAEDPTVAITAKTAPGTNASTRILEKNGFVYHKPVPDDEIGEAWLWVRN